MALQRSSITTLAAAAVVVVAILLAAHVRHHLTPCEGVQILQASLAQCTPSIFAEKRPVVITDRVVDHDDLRRTVLRYLHLWGGRQSEVEPGKRTRAVARFTLLFLSAAVATSAAAVDIVHPKHPNEVVRVVLAAGRTLVLPPLWSYLTASKGVLRVSLV